MSACASPVGRGPRAVPALCSSNRPFTRSQRQPKSSIRNSLASRPDKPPPKGAELWGVTAISQNDVWVVGQVDTRPLSEHWDGRRWRVINMRREGALFAVDSASAGDTWAVGAQGLNSFTVNTQDGLVMHWNGR